MDKTITSRGTIRKQLMLGQTKAKKLALADIMECVGPEKEYALLYINWQLEIRQLKTIHTKIIQF
jgi:hypothetical protein